MLVNAAQARADSELREANLLRDSNNTLAGQLAAATEECKRLTHELSVTQAALSACEEGLRQSQAQNVADKEAAREDLKKASEDWTRRFQGIQGRFRAAVVACASVLQFPIVQILRVV